MNRVLENLGAHPQESILYGETMDQTEEPEEPENENEVGSPEQDEEPEGNTQEGEEQGENEETEAPEQQEYNAEPTTRDLLDAVERNESMLQKLLDLQSEKENTEGAQAARRVARKAYDEEWKKHFWGSTFVSFLFGVSVGILTRGIISSLRN